MKYSGKGKTRSENVSEHDKHYRIISLRAKETPYAHVSV